MNLIVILTELYSELLTVKIFYFSRILKTLLVINWNIKVICNYNFLSIIVRCEQSFIKLPFAWLKLSFLSKQSLLVSSFSFRQIKLLSFSISPALRSAEDTSTKDTSTFTSGARFSTLAIVMAASFSAYFSAKQS